MAVYATSRKASGPKAFECGGGGYYVGSVKVSASMYGSVDQSCGWSETPHWSCSTCEQVMRSAGGASRKGDVESRWCVKEG